MARAFPLETRDRSKMPLPHFIQHFIGGLAGVVRQEKEIKGARLEEERKQSSFNGVDEKGVLQKATSQGSDPKFLPGQVMVSRHFPGQ